MVKITQDLFVESLHNIIKGYERKNKFENAISEIGTGYFVSDLCNEWLETAINLLVDAVGDKDEGYGTMIEWFLFEDVEKKVYISTGKIVDGKKEEIEVDVSTPELLYNYFVEYGDKNE